MTDVKKWNCPSGQVWTLCEDMLTQTHAVIGGTTGAGKSTFLHSLMYSALIHSPARVQFVLIDMKAEELYKYADLPHCIAYAETPKDAARALAWTLHIMDERHKIVRQTGKKWSGAHVYVIIDEVAVLMSLAKRPCLEQLANIMRMGRSTGIHVILSTQNPARSSGGGIPSELQQNVTSVLALRTRSAIDSRILIGQKGAEDLPKHGAGLYWNDDGINRVAVPMTDEAELNRRIMYWKNYR